MSAPRSVPGEVLVKFRAGVSPEQALEINRRVGGVERKRIPRGNLAVVRLSDQTSVDAAIAAYRRSPLVEYAEPNLYAYLDAAPPARNLVPNDPGYGLQWHYPNVNLPSAWDISTGSSLVVVAVIDDGFLFSHADLIGVTVQGRDFVNDDSDPNYEVCDPAAPESHGSHVSGTIAAATNNGVGVSGVNWGGAGRTKIMPLRVFGNYGGVCTATLDDIVEAIYYAADHSARVINMSLGLSAPSPPQSLQDAVNYAVGTGVIVVASAGNSNQDLDASPRYPVCLNNVVGVAATDISNGKAYYSNFGSCVDISAPGGDVTTDLNGDGYADGVLSTTGTPTNPTQYIFFQGTSMAAPHVAGLAALLVAKGVTGPSTIQSVLQSTATDLGASGYDFIFGWGKINAAAAMGAPAPINPVRAFTGDLSGSILTVRSNMVAVGSDGTFIITSAQSGVWTVFAWQDANANNLIDAGDLFGSTAGVTINPGATTTGVSVLITERPMSSSPITLAGSASARR